MKIYDEVAIEDFEFWSGALSTAEFLKAHDLFEHVAEYLESDYEEMSETELNDFFWHEDNFIAELLGYNDWQSLEEAYQED